MVTQALAFPKKDVWAVAFGSRFRRFGVGVAFGSHFERAAAAKSS